MAETALAIDVGGTKLAAALVTAAGQVLHAVEVPTSAGHGAERVFDALVTAVRRVLGHESSPRVHAVGLCSAGPIDAAAGAVSPVNIADWQCFPLVDRIRELVPGVPIVLAGDGVALAAAEHAFGAARSHDDVLCMTVSTGVGGGLVLGGRVHAGPSGNAGHVGHIVVDPRGARCRCGARGCVETLAGGRALVRRAVEAGWTPPTRAARTATGLAVAARSGDPIAVAAFDTAGRALAAAVSATAALVDIRVAVIGGGVAQSGDLLFGVLRRHLADQTRLSFTRGVTVVPAALHRDGCLIGAARLALDPAHQHTQEVGSP